MKLFLLVVFSCVLRSDWPIFGLHFILGPRTNSNLMRKFGVVAQTEEEGECEQMSGSRKRQHNPSSMDVEYTSSPSTLHYEPSSKKARQVEKLSNDIYQNLNIDESKHNATNSVNNNTNNNNNNKMIIDTKEPPIAIAIKQGKEQNILVLLESIAKDKSLREDKECMATVNGMLQERFGQDPNLQYKVCDNPPK